MLCKYTNVGVDKHKGVW